MDEQLMERVEKSLKDATQAMSVLRKGFEDVSREFYDFQVKSHVTTGGGKLRIWWLSYGVDILCPNCKFCIIPIEEAWCGCTPIPRKLKKWCKGRRAVYKETQ